jgi:hypothetical protein
VVSVVEHGRTGREIVEHEVDRRLELLEGPAAIVVGRGERIELGCGTRQI